MHLPRRTAGSYDHRFGREAGSKPFQAVLVWGMIESDNPAGAQRGGLHGLGLQGNTQLPPFAGVSCRALCGTCGTTPLR